MVHTVFRSFYKFCLRAQRRITMGYRKRRCEMSFEDQHRELYSWVAVAILICILLGALALGRLTATPALATQETRKCSTCHSYLTVVDRKFTSAYPEFKPISPWRTTRHPAQNPWYRVYAKGEQKLGTRRYADIVKVVPLADGRVAVNTYGPNQRNIAILP